VRNESTLHLILEGDPRVTPIDQEDAPSSIFQSSSSVPKCPTHPDLSLGVYCQKEGCGVFICSYCALADHQGHSFLIVEEMQAKFRQAIALCDTHCVEVEAKCAGVVADITTATRRLHAAADVRHKELVGEVQEIGAGEVAATRAELQSLRRGLEELTRALHSPRASQTEVVAALRAAAAFPVLACPALEVVLEACAADPSPLLGRLLHRSALDLAQCTLGCETGWRAALGEPFRAVLQLRNAEGQALGAAAAARVVATVEATVAGGAAGREGVVVQAEARSEAGGCVGLSFTPRAEHPWPLSLRVAVGGRPLPGTPPLVSLHILWPVGMSFVFRPGGAKGQVGMGVVV